MAAHPTPVELRMVVSEALDVDVADITRVMDPEVAAFEAIQWYLERGRLPGLVVATAAARPTDARLKALADRFRTAVVVDGPLRRDLRTALTEAFGTVDRFRMFLAEDLDVHLSAVSRATDLPAVAFEAVVWFLRQGQLWDLAAAAARVHPTNVRLQSLRARSPSGSTTNWARPACP